MKKRLLYGAIFVLGIIMSGCQSKTTTLTTSSEVEIAVSENTAAYSKTYKKQTLSGENSNSQEVTMDDPKRKEAYDNLQKYKSQVQDKAILNALSIIDEFYISNNTLQATRRAYGVKTESDVYKKVFGYFADDLQVNANYDMAFQGTTYHLSDIGPKALKVHVNSLQESAAYEVVFAKVEDKKVYLHLRTPAPDSYQYYVQATYRDNYKTFFQSLEEEAKKAQQDIDVNKRLLITFLYYLEAVGGEEGKVDLVGMSWGRLRDIYLSLDVNDDNTISLTDEMVSAISQMTATKVNDKLKSKFQQLEGKE